MNQLTRKPKISRNTMNELLIVGLQMSNLCYNLAQRAEPVSQRNREIMAELVRKWDAITGKFHAEDRA